MMAFAFGSLIFPILIVLAVAVAVRTIVVTVRVPPRVSREPVCEVCNYRVAGLSTFSCPECGTDLRNTGIITLPMEVKRRGSMSGAIISWIFLMAIIGGIVSALMSMLMFRPVMAAASNSMSTTTTTPLTPGSGAYSRIDVTATVNYGAGMRPPAPTIVYALVKTDGSTYTLTFAPLASTYTVTDPAGAATTSNNDGKGPDALFAAAGLNLSDPNVAAEVRELATIDGVMSASPYTSVGTIRMRAFTPGGITMSSTSGMPPAPSAAFYGMFLVGGLLWLALLATGIVFIVVRRKQLLRQHVSTATPTPAAPTPC
jgi:hypothetical protein